MKFGVDIGVHLKYNTNGNILTMNQSGLKINTSPLIDQLSYTYQANSNKLSKVVDAANDYTSTLGDFKYNPATKGSTDYAYDDNGNLISDANKKISSISYNYLNLPSVTTVAGTGTVTFTYDAAGNKLKKITVDNTVSPAKTNTTLYVGGAVYENDTFQLIAHEEGRIRFLPSFGGAGGGLVYDYFLKDHLGNVRMVLTEQKDTSFYPPASMETAQATTEEALYANLPSTRTAISTIPGYPTDTYTNPNEKVAKVRGDGNKIGPSIILKVMAGDKFNIRVSSWYKKNGATPGSPNSIAADLVTNLINSLTGSGGPVHGTVTSTELTNSGVIPTTANSFLSNQPAPGSTKPKAYINWVLLDEQFKFVQSSSGAEQVGDDNTFTVHTKTNMPIDKNGYLYVFVSNETPNISVYWDNLQITHIHGQILEETHYYPFGLTMAGISSKALQFGGAENRYKYNGKELQHNEFSDRSGLETYDFGARMQDPQLGRWWTVDPLAHEFPAWSPYSYGFNNPIFWTDPTGAAPEPPSTIVDERGNVVGGSTTDGDLGVYRVSGVTRGNFDASKIEQYKNQGTKIGETYSLYSFQNPSTGKWLGHVNMDNGAELSISKATQTLGKFMSTHSWKESLDEYMNHAGNFKGAYDLKTFGLAGGRNNPKEVIDAYAYEASFFGNKIMPRRDQGNFFAGRAANMLGLSEATMLSGFGAYQQNGNKINGFWNKTKIGLMSAVNWLDQQIMGAATNGTPAQGVNITPVFKDDKVSEDLQRAGYNQMKR